ncbi:hypothetical protein Acr_08g0008510 [Actinidia rufa]|uniref:glutathione transferase n=1 Tax=Actinidia rufa TaxID=165716 RepID=A0A7J0F184_9ERIC|nr:hypothetical protein Acr_08g0008510 [Actinidia rufa]
MANTLENPQDSSSSSSSAPKLVLYSHWQSSCSWRVRFALNLKGLPYEYKAVNFAEGEQFTPEFEKLNPLRFVPILVDGDLVVSDSYAILLYLEEKYPQNALLPVDPWLKALNLQAASIVTSSIQPLHMLSVLKIIEEKVGPEERLPWAQYNIEKGFMALEKLLKDWSGKYATGDKIYMSKFPILSMIYESYETLPEFQASLPDRQPDAILVGVPPFGGLLVGTMH